MLWDMPDETGRTYDDLVAALRQRYGSEHQREIFKLELDNRRRRPGKVSMT